MAKAKGGLGKGLAALIPELELKKEAIDLVEEKTVSRETKEKKLKEESPKEEKKIASTEVIDVAVSRIGTNPWQPRHHFNEDDLMDLTESIRQQGVLSPLLVVRDKENFTLVSGERRLRAAKRAGLNEVPVMVRELSPSQMAQIALIENIQRADLLPLEEAKGYDLLMQEHNYTAQELSPFIGKSRSHIANMVRLLRLPESVQDFLNEGKLTAGHARALLGLEDPALQEEMAKDIVAKGLSVRAVEGMIKDIKDFNLNLDKPKQGRETFKNDKKWKNISDQLTTTLQTQVKIRDNGKQGRLEIAFYGDDDLQRILDALQLETY